MRKKESSFRITDLPNSTYIFSFTFILASLLVPNFFSPSNISNLILQACILMLLSVGMSICLMIGCIDLSLGGIVSMTGVIIALLLRGGVNGIIAILIGFVSGILFGFLNGMVVTKLKVAPFIATFGMGSIAQSIANILSDKRTIAWESGLHTKVVNLLGGSVLTIYFGDGPSQILSISVLAVITIIIIGIIVFLFYKTNALSNVCAVGANEEAARLSGIKTSQWKIKVYMLSGFLAGVAGMVVMIRTNSLQPTVGEGLEFQAVVAAVLGGNSLKGGKGSIPGAILGALTLYTIRNSMSLWGIDTSVVMVATGIILIFGILLNETVTYITDQRALKKTIASDKELIKHD